MCVCACLSNNKLEMSNVQAVHTAELVGGRRGVDGGAGSSPPGYLTQNNRFRIGASGGVHQNSETCALTFLTHCM